MPLTRRKTVLIADDHALLAEGLARLMSAEYEILGIVSNGRRLVREAARTRPDLVLLDINMPELNGIEAARQIHSTSPNTRIVFVTQHIDPQYLRAAFQAGGLGYVAKQSASEELLTALRRVNAGGTYITPLLEEKVGYAPIAELRKKNGPQEEVLTTRQREVLQMVAEGRNSRAIAAALNISAKTVEFHKKALMDQTGLRTTAELTRYAITSGIVSL